MEIREPLALMNNSDGKLSGDEIKHSQKLFKDITFIYKNIDNVDPEMVMYDVYSYEKAESGKEGDLLWGMTVLHPVTVNGECNMTRGHWHLDRNCAEFYYGITGNGLLMFMDDEGQCFCEKVYPGSLHYIDGKYAHRLINTGDEDMKVGACWPVKAGHNYEATEKQPFNVRVFLRDGKVETEEL